MTNQQLAKDALDKITMMRNAGLSKEADAAEKKLKEQWKKENPQAVNKTPSIEAERHLAKFITHDERLIQLKDIVRSLVSEKDSVLILGESGTGKQLIAKALHGDRSVGNNNNHFVSINCAGMPEELFESEMFGHEKGSFSGADKDKEGLMEFAKDGTLFLDEIGDMPLKLQAKLLKAIEEGCIRRVGSLVERNVFCRIVAATHHDLPTLVGVGKFRLDLFARLSVFPLITIPLRDRLQDIEPIVNSLDKTKRCYKESGVEWLKHTYPLNVRSVQHIVRQWEVLGKVL